MFRRSAFLLFFPFLAGIPALAQSPSSAPATQAQVAALEHAVHSAQLAGDNAWVLVSAALVLLMTAPGLTLFYGGLVRRKNILGIMMQSFAMMGLITILSALIGYSLAFGHGNAFIGGFEQVFLRGVGLAPNPDYASTIPEQTFMVCHLMFAIITPALITGALAERVKFGSLAVFLCLWSLLVYCPMADLGRRRAGNTTARLVLPIHRWTNSRPTARPLSRHFSRNAHFRRDFFATICMSFP